MSASDIDNDANSVDTAPAGVNYLLEQRLSGKQNSRHQLRSCDIRLFVPASQEADETMIAAAKLFCSKAKEMDNLLVIYPATEDMNATRQ
jgi:hypothetical protein